MNPVVPDLRHAIRLHARRPLFSLAAIGIIKGKPFAPDARMKKILTEALDVANATSRSLLMNSRDPRWYYYPGSAWMNFLFISGYEFETPIPEILRTIAKNKWKMPGSIELEYEIPEGSDTVKEVGNCLEFCRRALA